MKQLQKYPINWSRATLGDCITLMRSGLSRLLSEEDIGIPVLRSCNIGTKYPVFENLKYWYEDDPKGANVYDYILKNGDILINFINSISQIGKACLFKSKINRNCIYTTNILRLIPNEKIFNEFLFLVAQMDRYDWYISIITKPAVNQASFTTKDLKKYSFLLPPLPEQKAIADLLSTWDEGIEKTERLILAKEKRFKGLLRILMNPNDKCSVMNDELKNNSALSTHTSAFAKGANSALSTHNSPKTLARGAWKKVKLGEVCEVITPPKKLQKDEYLGNGNYPVLDQSQKQIAGWTNVEKAIIYSEQPLIIFGDHTCVLKISKVPFAQGADGIKILSTKKQYFALFIYYCLLNNPVIPEGYKRHFSVLKNKKISLPPLPEQHRIADILSTAQQEIDLLKQLAEKYKNQKHGLMQKLLTGDWRVKNEVVNKYEEKL